MLRFKSFIWVVLLAVAGCSAPKYAKYVIQTPFNESMMTWSQTRGDATIKGQGFLKTIGGDVKTCAGNDVLLMPSNAYTQEAVRIGLRNGDAANLDVRLAKYMKMTRCDAQGNFSFRSLASGDWFVITTATWGVPDRYTVTQEGGVVMQGVNLAPGELKEVILSK